MPASLALLTTLASFDAAGSAAQAPLDACALLTPTEVGATLGATATPRPSEMIIPSGPAKGQTMRLCTWSDQQGGMLTVAAIRITPGSTTSGLAILEQALATLKASGWTEESKDFAGGKCLVMTPPASLTEAPVSTGCFAEAKGMGVSVGSMGKTRVPMEKVKPLLDKLIQRLP
jgi:hypothetical protein